MIYNNSSTLSAINFTTGTDTAFPANEYNLLADIFGSLYSFGKPCKLKHSLGVILRIPLLSNIIGTL